MTRPSINVTADMLHGYVDGQLSESERRAVETYIADHPDAAALVSAWQQQADAIRTLYDPVAVEVVPPRLSVQRIARDVAADRALRFRNIAAALILVAIGATAGWAGRDYLTPAEAASDHLIEEAVGAHTLYVAEKTHAVEVPADAPNLMKWLSNRIAVAFDAPDLSGLGYRFIGGRLLPGYGSEDAGPGPAAQLMYQNASDQRLTLYVTSALADKKEVWEFRHVDGVAAYYWANDKVTCTVVAGLPETDVRQIGKAVFEQLTRRADSSWDGQR